MVRIIEKQLVPKELFEELWKRLGGNGLMGVFDAKTVLYTFCAVNGMTMMPGDLMLLMNRYADRYPTIILVNN